jgi:hypothetical protein
VLFVGKKPSSKGRGKVLALAGSIVVSAALFYAQSAEPPADVPTAGPAAQQALPPGLPPSASPPAAELLAASAPVPSAAIPFELPPGIAPENGLQVNTIRTARAISVMFPEITTIGGYRQDPLKWHPNGLAIDVMIPDHNSEAGIRLGNQIAGYALANAKRWGVIHVIWRQGFYPGIGAPSWTADYGNETANHFDHVHIATNGGGYPSGGEKYFI